MGDSTSKPSKPDSLSANEEREMRDMLRDIFASDFPNPERRGCPENVEAKLKALAWRRRFPEAQEIISHLGSCSPCYQEHAEFVRQQRSRQRLYRLAAVAVLVVGVGIWISWKLMRGAGLTNPEVPPIVNALPPERLATLAPVPELEKQKAPAVQVAILDLRKRGITRGENSTEPEEDLNLPRGRLKLSIYLPFGSEVGQYEVRISGRKKQVAAAKGAALMRNHITVLDVNIDTGAIEAGRYQLAIRQVGWGWYGSNQNLTSLEAAFDKQRNPDRASIQEDHGRTICQENWPFISFALRIPRSSSLSSPN
jgi:hypothetical protein